MKTKNDFAGIFGVTDTQLQALVSEGLRCGGATSFSKIPPIPN